MFVQFTRKTTSTYGHDMSPSTLVIGSGFTAPGASWAEPKVPEELFRPGTGVRRLNPVLLVIQKSPRSKDMLTHTDKLKPCYGEHPSSWLTSDLNAGGADPSLPEATSAVSSPSPAILFTDSLVFSFASWVPVVLSPRTVE